MDFDGRSPPRRLGILGGTFDPLHVGHLVAARAAGHAFELDLVMFVPAGDPWQKPGFSDPEDRYLMTALGTVPEPRFAVSRMELDRRGPTYTADTLAELADFYDSSASLYFIAGADTVRGIGSWHRYEEIRALGEVIAVTRPGVALDDLEMGPDWPRILPIEMPHVDVSSTMVRELVRAGRPVDRLVPPEVAGYIRAKGLYLQDAEAQT